MSDTAAPNPAPGEVPPAAPADAPQKPGLIDSIADLLQMLVDWLRQEAGALVHDKVVMPVQRLGLTLVSATAAGCLAVLGIAFVAVALLLLLAGWLGWPGALFLIGGVLLVGAGVFTYLKMRSIQR